MPIKIPQELPAWDALQKENIFVMDERRAVTQDIRPLRLAVLNLMPTKITTETQIIRLLSNTPLQIELTLLRTSSHKAHNTSEEHMETFYRTFEEVKNERFDGLIITGAPVERMEFEQVDYWDELCGIIDWSKTNVQSTLYICWGAQAGLYHSYGIGKSELSEKAFGVFKHYVTDRLCPLVRGFDDVFFAPHSRYTGVLDEDIAKHPEITVLARSKDPTVGVYIAIANGGREVYVTGHSEYDRETLLLEYERDQKQGLGTAMPENYFKHDDSNQGIMMNWRSHAHLLYSNWLNYYVYQATPYDLNEIR